jgi:hypothetical protein
METIETKQVKCYSCYWYTRICQVTGKIKNASDHCDCGEYEKWKVLITL